MKKIFLIIPLILLMAGGIILLKKRQKDVKETPVATEMIHAVTVVKPGLQNVVESAGFLARLESVNSAAISSKLSGRISKVLVKESQNVRRGDLLIKIDDQEIRAGIKGLQAQLSSARARHEYAKNQYGRNLAMFKAGGLAKENLEESRVADSAALAAVADFEQKILSLENQLDYLQIKAPFDGIIGTIFLRPGALAAPGVPLLSLNSPAQKLTFSYTPATNTITTGQKVQLKDGKSVGTVTTLYNDAKNGLAVAEIKLDTPLGKPNNSFLSINVIQKTVSGCTVPVRSLLHRADRISIMVYQNKQFKESRVTLLARDKNFAAIDPCPDASIAVAAEAKLSLLPTYGRIRIIAGDSHE